ncbi:MAG: AmmeMemoRadiSam system protein A [Acidobacteriota bacterium]|nr:AmmeMemoRadiSam system protein A [Acidobacteriota bacterium]
MYPLNNSARDYLLKAARSTIEAYLRSGVRPVPDPPSARELLQKRGAFVTLYLRGRLCGCVGYVWPLTPLYRAVPECAVSAAVEDARFRPLNLTDLPETEIELSVLSGLDRVGGASEVLVGTHGLLVSQETRRGLLLPKVAVEHRWTPEQFLEQTCLKAGLSPQAWTNGATVERFTATVFGDKWRVKSGE